MTALPYPQEAGSAILKLVREKVKRSPFYRENEQYLICICQTDWRKKLFFSSHQQSGGLCYPGSRVVYINGADIINNRLIAPSGKAVMDERTLDYFIAHEITHSMVGKGVGILRFLVLPPWIKEGYADYIGRGGVFLRPGARESYLSDATEMTTPVMAPYLRYNFLVSYLSDQLHWTPDKLHKNPVTQDVIERQVRQFLIK